MWNSNSRICSFEAKDVLHPIHREQTAKGIKKSETKKKKDMIIIKPAYSIRSNEYEAKVSMNQIRSHCHEIYSIKLNKIALSLYDDKRFILEDGVNTVAHGHYKIRK